MKPDETVELPMVCGRCIHGNPIYFPKADYRGKEVYFCTDFCRNAFKNEPDRFYSAHRHVPAPEPEK